MYRWIIFTLFVTAMDLAAQPGTVTEHLKIDQFGYPPYAEKICVINNPTAGFDFLAGDFYTPGGTLQVRNAFNDALVMSGPATDWNGGAYYDLSGDRIWWFDFSSVTTDGSYYIYDPVNNRRSFFFDISQDVYVDVLKQSVRMFFYQRAGFAKDPACAYEWSDGASHLGTQQDLDCRLVTNPQPSTSKQLNCVGDGLFDLIVTNPPYVAERDVATLQREVRDHEPLMALSPGGDGLGIIRRIFAQAIDRLAPDGSVLMEIGFLQHEAVEEIARISGFSSVSFAEDLAGVPRIVHTRR